LSKVTLAAHLTLDPVTAPTSPSAAASVVYRRATASLRGAFWAGALDALSSPALVSCASYIGLGSLIRELSLGPELAVASTVLTWALPAQVASIEMYALAAPIASVVIAVLLINFRFLPMVISLIPLFRSAGVGGARLYLLAHLVAASTWILTMLRGPEMPPEQRVPYFLGCSCMLVGSSVVGILIGYVVAGAVPREVTYGLVFLNPLSFMLLMLVDLRQRVRILALVFGVAAGPALHLVSPTWGLLIAGLTAGTAAFAADRWLPSLRTTR
jgi:predicted branched-subunit amino acid permease